MGSKVCKFGGTSLADADQILKVKAIIEADTGRRYVVPSAPGKRSDSDTKITDLFYLCHEHTKQGIAFDDVFKLIAERYQQIVDDLGLTDTLDMQPRLEQVKQAITDGETKEYAASRGEYLNGPIIAAALGYEFIDAAEIIHFDKQGKLDNTKTHDAVSSRLAQVERAVIPGFYGSDPDGNVRTFSRGGSDITGAIVAAGAGADVYENWTDVSGLLMADPRIIKNPKPIDAVTYRELRELAYMGASVLHDEAIFPVRQAGIPVNIRNTNQPDDQGTMIVPDDQPIAHKGSITGIAGRKNFTVITIYKALMNSEVGFGRKILTALESHGISFEHTPTGIDTMGVVIEDEQLNGKRDELVELIKAECKPDTIDVTPGMALIATVGKGMAHTPGTAANLFAALAQANVNIRMIDQGSSEINIIVGIESTDFETAMHAIYNQFVN